MRKKKKRNDAQVVKRTEEALIALLNSGASTFPAYRSALEIMTAPPINHDDIENSGMHMHRHPRHDQLGEESAGKSDKPYQ